MRDPADNVCQAKNANNKLAIPSLQTIMSGVWRLLIVELTKLQTSKPVPTR